MAVALMQGGGGGGGPGGRQQQQQCLCRRELRLQWGNGEDGRIGAEGIQKARLKPAATIGGGGAVTSAADNAGACPLVKAI